jgi:hypothetical protein
MMPEGENSPFRSWGCHCAVRITLETKRAREPILECLRKRVALTTPRNRGQYALRTPGVITVSQEFLSGTSGSGGRRPKPATHPICRYNLCQASKFPSQSPRANLLVGARFLTFLVVPLSYHSPSLGSFSGARLRFWSAASLQTTPSLAGRDRPLSSIRV